MIRRKKLTIFTDAKDATTVLELKKMIEGEYDNVNTRMNLLIVGVQCRAVYNILIVFNVLNIILFL